MWNCPRSAIQPESLMTCRLSLMCFLLAWMLLLSPLYKQRAMSEAFNLRKQQDLLKSKDLGIGWMRVWLLALPLPCYVTLATSLLTSLRSQSPPPQSGVIWYQLLMVCKRIKWEALGTTFTKAPGTENQLAVLDALSTSEAEVFTGADSGGQPSWEHFSKPSGSVVSSLYRMQIHKEAPPGAPHPWLVRLCAESQGHWIRLCHTVHRHGQKLLQGLPEHHGAGQESVLETIWGVSLAWGVTTGNKGRADLGPGVSRCARPGTRTVFCIWLSYMGPCL